MNPIPSPRSERVKFTLYEWAVIALSIAIGGGSLAAHFGVF
jgi:hypothetical protein